MYVKDATCLTCLDS